MVGEPLGRAGYRPTGAGAPYAPWLGHGSPDPRCWAHQEAPRHGAHVPPPPHPGRFLHDFTPSGYESTRSWGFRPEGGPALASAGLEAFGPFLTPSVAGPLNGWRRGGDAWVFHPSSGVECEWPGAKGGLGVSAGSRGGGVNTATTHRHQRFGGETHPGGCPGGARPSGLRHSSFSLIRVNLIVVVGRGSPAFAHSCCGLLLKESHILRELVYVLYACGFYSLLSPPHVQGVRICPHSPMCLPDQVAILLTIL